MKPPRNGPVTPKEGPDGLRLLPAGDDWTSGRLVVPVRRAITRTRGWLLAQQGPDGSWCAELEGDTILESETILLLAFLGREHSELARQLAKYLIEHQLPDGGWAMCPGGGVEISGSVKAYFALKLTGHDVGAEYMQRARRSILAHGGADAVNSYTRFFLAMLGQIPYDQCPAVPPEMVLLPNWFPVNLYAVSTWSRTIIVPLSIVWAKQPVRRLEPDRGIRELFLKEPDRWPRLRCPGLPGGTGMFSWDCFFRTVDRVLRWCRRHGVTPWRGRAIRAAEAWMLKRFRGSDGLGAIFPPIVWSLVALRSLGYADDSPEARYCHRQLEDLVLQNEQSGASRLQPCKSPVWDTAIAVRALASGGIRSDSPAIRRAVFWLLRKQVLRPGDWCETVHVEPGGWCFEQNNDFYPDCDDTAMVLMALGEQFDPAEECRSPGGPPPDLRLLLHATAQSRQSAAEQIDLTDRSAVAIQRGLRWLLAMQNDDGGWAAFDRNNNRRFLCYVPFADHNAMIDPSTPDLTGRVLEAVGKFGFRAGHPVVDRALGYLRRTQEADGSWLGRWGVNQIYGTWQALVGLAGIGISKDDPAMIAGANWLAACQQPCGGWGETPESYADPGLRGHGPPTASQTAWAVMGLLAAGLENHPAVVRGIQFLVDRQQPDGTWDEPEFTGTGFPRVFYLRYHYYPIYFPLMALSRWAATAAVSLVETAMPQLRVVAVDEEEVGSREAASG
jgi:squalene-hopene/tetraprenyl-beta-curcumene cyclase